MGQKAVSSIRLESGRGPHRPHLLAARERRVNREKKPVDRELGGVGTTCCHKVREAGILSPVP